MNKVICEICGKEVSTLVPVFIEKSTLSVCPVCAKFGRNVEKPGIAPTPVEITQRLQMRSQRQGFRDIFSEESTDAMAENYSSILKNARDKKGWSQEDIGKKVNEKKSVIAKIESGNMEPSIALARRLERVLGVKIVEKSEGSS